MAASNFSSNGVNLDNIFVLRQYTTFGAPIIPGGAFVSGNNFPSGQLGQGNRIGVSSPVQFGVGFNWDSLHVSTTVTVGKKEDGTIWKSGNYFGGATSSPVQIGTNTWAVISGGTQGLLGIKPDKTLWAIYHDNVAGSAGVGNTLSVTSEVQIGFVSNWSSISTAYDNSYGIRDDGTLWAWGNNLYGQLGTNAPILSDASTPVQIGTDSVWKQASAGNGYAMAVKEDGTLWVWGRNDFGQLGLNDAIHRSSPVQIGVDTNWRSVACAHQHSVAVKTNGTLWAWGDNTNGQLGIRVAGISSKISSPIQVGSSTNWNSAKAYYAGFSAATKTDGTLWTWGDNTYGQLGINGISSRSSPVQVGTNTGWLKLAENHNGAAHFGAIKFS